MSYILEALKKAQAERQLGGLPTIHAPTLDGGAAKPPLGPLKRPLVLVAGAMGVTIVALLALVVWRQPGQQSAAQPPAATPAAPAVALPPPVAASAVPPAAVAAPLAPPVAPPLAPAVAPASPLSEPAEPVAAPAAAKVKAKPADAAPSSEAADRSAKSPPSAAVAAKVARATPPAEPAATEATPAPAKAAVVQQEETAPPLRELPEPIQRSIPPIVMGGYMYSKNPADRLLLIDKVLRHEGEEVAPGLVLEKLQPKAAVFSFRGYRYRVPY